MRYSVKIKLADGNEIQARVEAPSDKAAEARVMALPQTQEFINSTTVEHIDVQLSEAPTTAIQYVLQPSTPSGWWTVADLDNYAVLRFQQGAFNATQSIDYLDDAPLGPDSALKLATINRQMADWLLANHKDLL